MNINDVKRKHLLYAIKWCYDKWGFSLYNPYYQIPREIPKLVIKTGKSKTRGTFNPENNTIIVYKNANPCAVNYLSTILHEYTHYLQDMEEYNLYLDMSHDAHPYEIIAYEIESNHKRELKKAVQKYFKIK